MKKVGRIPVDPSIVAAESEALNALWAKAKYQLQVRQSSFGKDFEIGTQSAVGQFLNGKSSLSLKAAKGFAKGLGCKVSDFSPRLAELETAWPFELVDRDLYESLPTALQYKAQVRIQDVLEEIAAQAVKANGTSN